MLETAMVWAVGQNWTDMATEGHRKIIQGEATGKPAKAKVGKALPKDETLEEEEGQHGF